MSNFPEIVNGKFGGKFGEELLSLYRINPLFWGLGSFTLEDNLGWSRNSNQLPHFWKII